MTFETAFNSSALDFDTQFFEINSCFDTQMQDYIANTFISDYTGSYSITPKANQSQTLDTKNKVLINNITVFEVPYFDVSNNSGGITVTIGKDV